MVNSNKIVLLISVGFLFSGGVFSQEGQVKVENPFYRQRRVSAYLDDVESLRKPYEKLKTFSQEKSPYKKRSEFYRELGREHKPQLQGKRIIHDPGKAEPQKDLEAEVIREKARRDFMQQRRYMDDAVRESRFRNRLEEIRMKEQAKDGRYSDSAWEIGTELSNIRYKEPGVMKEEGTMYGVSFAYTYRGWLPPTPPESNNGMFKFDGRFSRGEVDYENSGNIDNIDDYILEFRGVVGKDYFISETATVTPYVGFGYRYLNDDTSGLTSTTGARGYLREANYYYSPLGLELINVLDRRWSLGAVLEYDHFWGGKQKSHLSDANPSYNDLENNQNEGYGLRGSLKVRRMTDRLNLLFEPFVRYWNVSESEAEEVSYAGVIIGYGYEPKNNSLEYGIRIAAEF